MKVFDDLFDPDGSEIYVKPAWLYFEQLPVTCRFGDLMKLVQAGKITKEEALSNTVDKSDMSRRLGLTKEGA